MFIFAWEAEPVDFVLAFDFSADLPLDFAVFITFDFVVAVVLAFHFASLFFVILNFYTDLILLLLLLLLNLASDYPVVLL